MANSLAGYIALLWQLGLLCKVGRRSLDISLSLSLTCTICHGVSMSERWARCIIPCSELLVSRTTPAPAVPFLRFAPPCFWPRWCAHLRFWKSSQARSSAGEEPRAGGSPSTARHDSPTVSPCS